MPAEYYRWKLAERFGWSLEYVDSLTMQDFHELLQVDDGRAKAKKTLENRIK